MSLETLYCDHMIHHDDPCGKCQAETDEHAALRDLEQACRADSSGRFLPHLQRLDAARKLWAESRDGLDFLGASQ